MGRILVSGVLLTLGCARGPGTFSGDLLGQPFVVQQAQLTGSAHLLNFEIEDKLTKCEEKLKNGRRVRLVLRSATDIPQPGTYELTDAAVPGVSVDHLVTNNDCTEGEPLPAREADVELVQVNVDPSVDLFEADLRVRLVFRDGEVLQGSVHGTRCRARVSYCEAN